jgi:hypothetical protein
MTRRTGARKGPTQAERRAAQAAALEAVRARIWSATEEQARVLRDAFDAGPEGLYVPVCGNVGTVCARLVAGGCGAYTERRHWTDTTRSVHDQRPIGWLTDYFFAPNAYGLELIGICPWPRNSATPSVTGDTPSEGAADATTPAAVGTPRAS